MRFDERITLCATISGESGASWSLDCLRLSTLPRPQRRWPTKNAQCPCSCLLFGPVAFLVLSENRFPLREDGR